MSSENAKSYFNSLADLGITQHLGSVKATQRLVELCRIGHGQVVLDIGCGVGATPCYLAKKAGCQVIGVDLLQSMVMQSRARAKAEGVAGRVAFQVADARKLPFVDDLFDAVIMESVNVFVENKLDAMHEYLRVTRPGGVVGFTETTWLKPPSPKEQAYYKRVFHTETLQAGNWIALLKRAGLDEVVGNAYPVNVPLEAKSQFDRYGYRGIIKAAFKILAAFFKDRSSRASLTDGALGLAHGMLKHMGYGIYAGRKESMYG